MPRCCIPIFHMNLRCTWCVAKIDHNCPSDLLIPLSRHRQQAPIYHLKCPTRHLGFFGHFCPQSSPR
jgi:hypothetical protein